MNNICRLPRSLVLVFLTLSAYGCGFYALPFTFAIGHEPPLTFKLVDADTDQPLTGVQGEQSGYPNDMKYHPGLDVTLPSSDVDGVVTTGKLKSVYNHTFTFTRPGYIDTGTSFSPTRPDEVVIPLPPSNPQYQTKGTVVSSKGTITLPMYRQRATTLPTSRPALPQWIQRSIDVASVGSRSRPH